MDKGFDVAQVIEEAVVTQGLDDGIMVSGIDVPPTEPQSDVPLAVL